MKKESLQQAMNAFAIESECISEFANYIDKEKFSTAVELLAKAQRIGTCGCGHSGMYDTRAYFVYGYVLTCKSVCKEGGNH